MRYLIPRCRQYEYVDDVAVIKAIEAMKEFIACKEDQFVFSTKNTDAAIELVRYAGDSLVILEKKA